MTENDIRPGEEGGGGGVAPSSIVMFRTLVSLSAAFDAPTVKLDAPLDVGMPGIVPALLRFKPPGRLPPALTEFIFWWN